jgi:hypothetical protein
MCKPAPTNAVDPLGEAMSTTLDADGMRLLALQHGEYEMNRDWDGALATMVPEPFYEFYPYRLRISGPDAIKELWTRVFTESGTLRCFDIEHIDLDAHEQWEMVGDDSIVHIGNSAFVDENGERRESTTVVRYRFAGDRMMSETMWACKSILPYLDTVFDATFRALSGVEQI